MTVPEVETPLTPGARRLSSSWLRVEAVRDYGIVFAFLAMFITLSLSSPVFLTSANLLNVLN
ncbi:MAG: hypothetical protein QOD70_1106, partial [Frankiales bacterium]|nr:hypothetical protein [Frankiales bacterium]